MGQQIWLLISGDVRAFLERGTIGRMTTGFIAHRGNIAGPSSQENTVDLAQQVLARVGVELDVWFIEGAFFLGHDTPVEPVDKFFLFDTDVLVHAKNLECLIELAPHPQVEVFFQESDEISLTSRGRRVFHSRVAQRQLLRADHDDILVIPDLAYRQAELGMDFKGTLVSDYCGDFPGGAARDFPVPLLVLDVDGVLTDGTKTYGRDGEVISKRFADRDFTAIKRLQAMGVTVVWLSGDSVVNRAIAEARGIPFYDARGQDGNIDKSRFVESLKAEFGANSFAYVGDDYYDMTILALADLSFAPSDASVGVRGMVDHVLQTSAGAGVVADIFENFFSNGRQPFAYDHV